MRSLFLNRKKDTSESLRQKGTRISAIVLDVVKHKHGYIVTCSPPEGTPYSERVFKSDVIHSVPKIGIGGEIDVFVDEVDADGEYSVEVPV